MCTLFACVLVCRPVRALTAPHTLLHKSKPMDKLQNTIASQNSPSFKTERRNAIWITNGKIANACFFFSPLLFTLSESIEQTGVIFDGL